MVKYTPFRVQHVNANLDGFSMEANLRTDPPKKEAVVQPIIYDVAVSIDGYIAGPGEDISKFAREGEVVDNYLKRLETYSCAIMGRATYEFGYRFGLEPGRNPYPRMKTVVFSDSMRLPEDSEVTVVPRRDLQLLQTLRDEQAGPIYLCGGGLFAGALLSSRMIDKLRLKRAPILLGDGTPLFGDADVAIELVCEEIKSYADGYVYQAYQVRYRE